MSHSRLKSELAERLARTALDCVRREYPNKISHVLSGDADGLLPRKLTPAFYGCYDWHSAVHNHWLLARLARLFPDPAFSQAAREALERNLAAENIQGEVAYLCAEGRQSFERPYGLAWLLQLAQELDEWGEGKLAGDLRPLEDAAVERLQSWLSKLQFPVRTGEHNQTAFALGLMVDYARRMKNGDFLKLLTGQAHRFYFKDQEWPFGYEPSGEDFLSPGLGEADLMRRVLEPSEFSEWLTGFLGNHWMTLKPVVSPDRSDPKFSHLDGLNMSRAWMLEGIASVLAENDARISPLQELAQAHKGAGLSALGGEHYVGSHWLGTFAVYLLTRRGITSA